MRLVGMGSIDRMDKLLVAVGLFDMDFYHRTWQPKY